MIWFIFDGMAELRRDPVSGSWVVVGLAWVKSSEIDVCPFCPGNEHLSGKPIREVRDAGGAWLVRCFPAANPIFMIEALPNKKAEGMYDRMGNVGAHEIVVESRAHTKTLSDFGEDELALVLTRCEIDERNDDDGGDENRQTDA